MYKQFVEVQYRMEKLTAQQVQGLVIKGLITQEDADGIVKGQV